MKHWRNIVVLSVAITLTLCGYVAGILSILGDSNLVDVDNREIIMPKNLNNYGKIYINYI